MLKIENLFNEKYYVGDPQVNKDMKDRKYKTPFDHFLNESGKEKNGKIQWYDPSWFFDMHYYVSAYHEVWQTIINGQYHNPLEHFIAEGLVKGYNPTPFFDNDFYLQTNPDVRNLVGIGKKYPTAFEHFIVEGYDKYQSCEYFDPKHGDYPFEKYVELWQQQVRNTCQYFPYLLIADANLASNIQIILSTFDFLQRTYPLQEDVNRYLAYQRLAKIKIDKAEQKVLVFDITVTKHDLLRVNNDKIIAAVVTNLGALDTLIQAGFDSATAISQTSKANFIAKTQHSVFENVFGKDHSDIVAPYYDNAAQIAAELSLHYLHSYQTLSPCVSEGWAFKDSLSFNGGANYPELFGKLDYFNIDENNSIFSPAAYFFELMRIATNPEQVKGRHYFRSLQARRPDLFEIPLDGAHTTQELPYLRVVNYVLGRHYLTNHRPVAENQILYLKDTYADKISTCETLAFQAIANARQLFYPPFMLPAAQICTTLKPYNTSLLEIYSAFQLQPSLQPDFNDFPVAREYLGLSQADVDWLINMNKVVATISLSDDIEVKAFYAATGLAKERLADLIPYDTELNSQDKRGTYQQLYINSDTNSDPIVLTVDYQNRCEKLKNLTFNRLQRLSTFTFLAKKLAISNTDLQSIFLALGLGDSIQPADLQTIARIVWLNQQSKLLFPKIASLAGKLSEDHFNNILNNPRFLKAEGAAPIEYKAQENTLLISISNLMQNKQSAEDSKAIRRLCIALGISPADLGLLVKSGDFLQQFKSNVMLLNWLYKAVNMAQLLGVSISEFIRLHHLAILQDPNSDAILGSLYRCIASEKIDPNQIVDYIVTIFAASMWIKEAGIAINSLYYVVYDTASAFYKSKIEESATVFLAELGQQVAQQSQLMPPGSDDTHRAVPVPSTPNVSLSALDKFICQKIADYFKEPFDLVATILKTTVQKIFPGAEDKEPTHPIAMYLGLRFESAAPKESTADGPTMDKILELFRLVMLAKLLNLKATENQKNLNDDVTLLCHIIQSKKAGQALILLDDVRTLQQLKQLQKVFNNAENDFLTYFNEKDKTVFLSLTGWNANSLSMFLNNFNMKLPDKFEPAHLAVTIHQLNYLQQLFAILQKLNNHTDVLLAFKTLKEQDENKPVTFQAYDQVAKSLYQLALTKSVDQQTNPLDDALQQFEEQKRDTLIHHLLRPAPQDLLDPNPSKRYHLLINEQLNTGESLLSQNGKYTAVLECDGNLAVYEISSLFPKKKRWETGVRIPQWKNGFFAAMQGDGNFVIYPNGHPAIWASRTNDQQARFVMLEDNGNLSLYKGKPDDAHFDKSLEPDLFTEYLDWDTIKTSADLSQYLLIDVDMSSCFLTSPIAQAIGSVQLYLQRCRMGIEKDTTLTILKPWWDWLENYRLWEANRKVLLQPENYIEPDLRIEQSAEFTQLTRDLLQTNLDQDAVNRVFRQYFHKMNTLSSLIYCDACATKQGDDLTTNVIYLFAHTRTAPYEYYLRTAEYTDNDIAHLKFSYWKKVDIDINAGVISSIYAFNRLFIFFVEPKFSSHKGTEVSGNAVKDTNPDVNLLSFKIKCTYQNSNGTWEAPQLLCEENSMNLTTLTQRYGANINIKSHVNNGVLQLLMVDVNDSNNPKPLVYESQCFNYLLNIVNVTMKDEDHIEINYLSSNIKIDRYLTVTVGENPVIGYMFDGDRYFQFDLYQSQPSFEMKLYHGIEGGPYVLSALDIKEIDNIAYIAETIKKIKDLRVNMDKSYLTIVNYFPISSGVHSSLINDFKQNLKTMNDILHALHGERFISNKFFTDYTSTMDAWLGQLDQLNNEYNDAKSILDPIIKAVDEIDQNIEKEIRETVKVLTSLITTASRADLIPVKNKPQNALLNNVNEAYLIQVTPEQTFLFTRLSSTQAVHQFNTTLLIGGFDDLYHLVNDANDANLESPFSSLAPTKDLVIGNLSNQIDFKGGFGNYYWEIFFHTPFYIANRLNAQQRFAEARAWYHYIFNPTIVGADRAKNAFRFPPFQAIDLSCDLLTDQKMIAIYRDHMFDPHAIAELRPIAYMKTVVMKYIKNLIDWADYEFSLNTRESITQAINLYLMASDLLGDKPCPLGSPERTNRVISFQDYLNSSIVFSEIAEQIFKVMENNLKRYNTALTGGVLNGFSPYFSLPENKDFIAYWDRISDRLFKIRHCQTMEGIKQQLDLFSPELDVNQLVRLAASPGGESIKEALNAPIPHYRFEVLLMRAKEMASQLIQLGSEVMSILEKQDFENLALISNKHQATTLNLISQSKQQQITEVQFALEQTTANLKAATDRRDYYAKLVQTGLLPQESNAKNLRISSQVFLGLANVASTTSQALLALPQAEIGFAAIGPYSTVSFGGMQLGYVAQAVASGFETVGNVLNFAADDLLVEAEYQRRADEWAQQQQQAENDIQIINKQLQISQIQLDIAKQDYENQQQFIKQQQELDQYYHTKFTNLDLYRWYIDQLLVVYRQAYEMAFGVAKSAEKAYNYELHPIDSKALISSSHYSFFRKGLLAGQLLQGEITMMEKAYLDEHERVQEVEKTISLKNRLGKLSFNEGQMLFTLPPEIVDEDFPNYTVSNRRIKRISVTVPALAKPYQNVNLILTLKKSYLPNGEGDSLIKPTQIIISTGVNDTGLFESSLHDARYLPFEGAWLHSDWSLEIGNPQDEALVNSISDVIFQLQYTAEFQSKPAIPSVL